MLSLSLGLALFPALVSPLAARTVCHTGLTGTTVCADGSVSRTTFPAFTGPIGGVVCDIGRQANHLCN